MPRPRAQRTVLLFTIPLSSSGCAALATLRSADVPSGPAFTVQASVTSRPGDQAGWLWSYDCPQNCDHSISALDLAFAYGIEPRTGPPFTLGLGFNGLFPYAEGYVQLRKGGRIPFGVGARLGLPALTWFEHQIYGRLDVPVGTGALVLFNPGVFYHAGNSPNGENPGWFRGLVQGVGIELGAGPVALTPGAWIVLGRAGHTSYGEQFGPETRAFGAISLGMTFRRTPHRM